MFLIDSDDLFVFISRAGNDVKAGKSFVFWGLTKEQNAVAVVGLGKKGAQAENVELLNQEKESIRVAVSGKF